MGLLSAIIALLLVLLGILLWRRRAYETVDFSDVEARRGSAAKWMASGEAAAAEEMMRAAVETLVGWPRALAHGDLASVLLTMERDAEAIEQLASACGLATGAPSEREELLEMRIRWARLLARAGRAREAEKVLIAADLGRDDSLESALAAEALAEFYVEEGRADEAVAILRPALAALMHADSDRAASAAVTLAHAMHLGGEDTPWQDLQALAPDLQGAALGNFCDRLASMDHALQLPMLESLVALLSQSNTFEVECEQLRALADSLES